MISINEVILFLGKKSNVKRIVKRIGYEKSNLISEIIIQQNESIKEELIKQEEAQKAELNKLEEVKSFMESIGIDSKKFQISPVETKAPKKKAKIKYQYTDEQGKVFSWSGLGVRPKWVVEQLETGKQLDTFLIK